MDESSAVGARMLTFACAHSRRTRHAFPRLPFRCAPHLFECLLRYGAAERPTTQHFRKVTGLQVYPTYIGGEAYLAAEQGGAAAEFQKIVDHSGIVWNCWTGALAHLGVARANALQAKTSQGADADAARVRALAAYEDFLTLWKDADPDIPIHKQAKAEYAKLQ